MKDRIKQTQKDCLDGRLSVSEAIQSIDESVGGIDQVLFKTGLKFKIVAGGRMYTLDINTRKKSQEVRLYGLAAAAYQRAQENGSRMPGEVHISRAASTKDHMDGIQSLILKYAA